MKVYGVYGGYYSRVGMHLEPTRIIEAEEFLDLVNAPPEVREFVLRRQPIRWRQLFNRRLYRLVGPRIYWFLSRRKMLPRERGIPCWCLDAYWGAPDRLEIEGPSLKGEVDLQHFILPETKFGWVMPTHPFDPDPSLDWKAVIGADSYAWHDGRLAFRVEKASVAAHRSRYQAVRLPAAGTAFDIRE